MRFTLALLLSAMLAAGAAQAATLPPHGPLRVLIVGDEVNPHALPAADLSQPADLLAAITDPSSGLHVDTSPGGVTLVDTDAIENATALLSVPFADPAAYDVLVYFSHRAPSGGTGAARQAAFVAAVEAFLTAGGGVVSFHHGAYLGAGKFDMQELLGVTASGSVPWNTIDGQNVINVAPAHFVTTFGVEYPTTTAYADVARGVAAGTYPMFNNTPDERYTTMEINPSAGNVELLFGSDYDQNGTTHILGWTHAQPAWSGVVVGYQPGEYQPLALDDLDGNNFQILANAIYFAAYGAPPLPAGTPWTLAVTALLLSSGAVFGRRRLT